MNASRRAYLLIADDYALTPGVSAGIAELALARRLSGTSAMVTGAAWRADAAGARGLRPFVSLGLHLNLTQGAPLGAMPAHAPAGKFPAISAWILQAVAGRVQEDEVADEIDRQIDAFESVAGAAPDHIDGHHHVHALPGIREALVRCLRRRYANTRMPLIRLPGDRPGRILARRAEMPKALFVAALSRGAGACFRAIGAPVNDGFSGFSSFHPDRSFAKELAGFERTRGPTHVVMCHPGHADSALAGLDPVYRRRDQELAALAGDPTLPSRICHPADHRDAAGFIDWNCALAE